MESWFSIPFPHLYVSKAHSTFHWTVHNKIDFPLRFNPFLGVNTVHHLPSLPVPCIFSQTYDPHILLHHIHESPLSLTPGSSILSILLPIESLSLLLHMFNSSQSCLLALSQKHSTVDSEQFKHWMHQLLNTIKLKECVGLHSELMKLFHGNPKSQI